MSAKDKLRPLLLTPPFAEGSNPVPFATLSTTQPLSHMWLTFKVYDNASDNSVKYYANELNGQKRYDYAMIEFVSDDGTIATCPAMILGFVQYNITLGIPTAQFKGEEELTLNTIQENMAVDNNLYVVVHTASDYVSSDQ